MKEQIDSTTLISLENYLAANFPLEKVLRTGWILMGIPEKDVQTVKQHTDAARAIAKVLVPSLLPNLDYQKTDSLICVHDIAEVITTDITPYDGVSPQEKRSLESLAIEQIIYSMRSDRFETQANLLLKLWKEYEERLSAEAIAAKQLDILEMWHQGLIYAKSGKYPQNTIHVLLNDKERMKFVLNENNGALKDYALALLSKLHISSRSHLNLTQGA